MSASDLVDDFLTEWHRIVAARDLDAVPNMLAEKVTLGAPPYWQKLEGRDLVGHLLGLIVHTIEGFTYHREWRNGTELALEFTGRIGKLDLQGVDLISLDESGRIRNLEVPMRPMNSVEALQKAIAPKMITYLQDHPPGPR